MPPKYALVLQLYVNIDIIYNGTVFLMFNVTIKKYLENCYMNSHRQILIFLLIIFYLHIYLFIFLLQIIISH